MINIVKKLFYFLIIFSITLPSFSQQINYRLTADFSIKEKNAELSSVHTGKIYYDLNTDIFVYNIYFPEKVDWVIHDTSFYTFKESAMESRVTIPKINSTNLIHLSLTASLYDYGLIESGLYKMEDVKNENDLIITTYSSIHSRLESKLGKIYISTKKGHLHGIVFLNPNGAILKKIFIEKSVIKKGLFIPTEILEITYKDNKENYKITTFDNIILNEKINENFYNYSLPYNVR
jgi:hypothetical protein